MGLPDDLKPDYEWFGGHVLWVELCLPPKILCCNPNLQYFEMWPYLEMGLLQLKTGVGWALNPIWPVSLKEEWTWTHPCIEGSLRRNTQRLVTWRWKQNLELFYHRPGTCLELQKAGRVKEESFSKCFGGQDFDLGLLTSRTVRQPPKFVLLYDGHPRERTHYTKEYGFEYNGGIHLYGMEVTEEPLLKQESDTTRGVLLDKRFWLKCGP